MSWKEKLTEVREEYYKANYAAARDFGVPKAKPYNDTTANGLTRCIIDFLTYSGWQAERINSTGRMIDRRTKYTDVLGHARQIGSTQWIKGSGVKGTADISATIAGKAVKIEVKIGRDRQSEVQRKYQQKVEASGGLYHIATSMEVFLEFYYEQFQMITE